MTKPRIKFVNAETGEEIEREMNAQELAQLEIDKANFAKQEANEITQANAKKVLLEKLGITEDEARLLLSQHNP